MIPSWATRPTVGLRPTTALLPDGQTIEPSVSVPMANAHRFGGRRDRRARARAARVPGEAVGVPRRPAASAPAVEVEPRILDRRRDEAAEVGPLGQVGLAQDHGACIAQPGDQPRVARDPAADQGERAGRRLHAVAGRDVVLDQDGDPVEGTARAAGPPLGVTPGGDRRGVGVGLDDGVEDRVQALDPPEVGRGQLRAAEPAVGHQRLELIDRGLEPWSALVRIRPWRQRLVDGAIVAGRMRNDPGRRGDPGRGAVPGGGSAGDDERVLERVVAGATDPDPPDRQRGRRTSCP